MLFKNVHSSKISFGIVQYITGTKCEVTCCIETVGADLHFYNYN